MVERSSPGEKISLKAKEKSLYRLLKFFGKKNCGYTGNFLLKYVVCSIGNLVNEK